MFVHILLDKLKVLPFHISLPLMAYANAPATNGLILHERLHNTDLLQSGWSVSSECMCATVYKFTAPLHHILLSLFHFRSTMILPGHLPWIPLQTCRRTFHQPPLCSYVSCELSTSSLQLRSTYAFKLVSVITMENCND